MSENSDAMEPVKPVMGPTAATEGGAIAAPDPPCDDGGPDVAVGDLSPPYVYALGRVEPRFPSLAVEKEFAQATGRAETAGLTNRGRYRKFSRADPTATWLGSSAGFSPWRVWTPMSSFLATPPISTCSWRPCVRVPDLLTSTSSLG